MLRHYPAGSVPTPIAMTIMTMLIMMMIVTIITTMKMTAMMTTTTHKHAGMLSILTDPQIRIERFESCGNLEKLAVFIFFLLRWSLMLWSLLDFQISNDFWLRFPASGTLFPCPFCPPDAVRADYAP